MTTLGALLTSFVAAFVGSLIPGMLNMTAISYCLRRGPRAAQRFVRGATLPFAFHAGVGLFFAGVLNRNPQILWWIRQMAVFLFFVLAVGFFYVALYPPKPVTTARSRWRGATALQIGFLLSIFNALAIPYFLAVTGFAVTKGWMTLALPDSLAFLAGVLLGSFAIFQCYLAFARYIQSRARFFVRHVNFFLAGLFLLLALWQSFNLYLEN